MATLTVESSASNDWTAPWMWRRKWWTLSSLGSGLGGGAGCCGSAAPLAFAVDSSGELSGGPAPSASALLAPPPLSALPVPASLAPAPAPLPAPSPPSGVCRLVGGSCGGEVPASLALASTSSLGAIDVGGRASSPLALTILLVALMVVALAVAGAIAGGEESAGAIAGRRASDEDGERIAEGGALTKRRALALGPQKLIRART